METALIVLNIFVLFALYAMYEAHRESQRVIRGLNQTVAALETHVQAIAETLSQAGRINASRVVQEVGEVPKALGPLRNKFTGLAARRAAAERASLEPVRKSDRIAANNAKAMEGI